MEGVVFSTFIVVFREALEASLILGIILTLLTRLNAKRYIAAVMTGVASAVVLSVALGQWLSSLTESAQEGIGPAIEGLISLAACGVLTYMFFWMEKQAKNLKTDLESRIEAALTAKDLFAMVSLPFFAVLREGAETVLFLKAVSIQSGGSVSWAGGFWGLAVAVAVTLALFIGGKKVPVRTLFRGTGFFIIFIAAGLLGYGWHELGEIGWVPVGIEHLYDMNRVINEKQGIGSFMKALFGYNGNPSLTETVLYWLYLFAMLYAAMKGRRVKA